MFKAAYRQCEAIIYRRDTFRYCGGKAQFKLHYTRSRCSRKVKDDSSWCWQHINDPYQALEKARA